MLDAGGEGFYRVAYPPAWRADLVDAGVLEPLERFSLIDDCWASVLAGRTPASELLDLVRRFGHEDELVVWRAVVSVLRGMARLVDGDALARLRVESAAVLGPTFDRLGWKPNGTETRARANYGASRSTRSEPSPTIRR